MSTRTRRSGPAGTDETRTSHTNTTLPTSSAPDHPNHPVPDSTPQRKRRLDVNPDNIIQVESGNRLKRRRSPSISHGDGEGSAVGRGAGLSPEQEAERREKAKLKGEDMWQAVMYEQESGGRFLASEFIGLPNRRQFPDYYALIKHPMSLTVIKEKLFKTCYSGASSVPTEAVPNSTPPQDQQGPGGLKVKLKLNVNGNANANGPNGAMGTGVEMTSDGEKYDGYRDLDEVKRDFDLIWGNAKRYNQKESGIYKDAQKLHKLTNNLYREAIASGTDTIHTMATSEDERKPTVSMSVAPGSDVKDEDETDKPRPTKKIKLGVSRGPAEAMDKDKDVHMSEPEQEVNVSKLIKAGIKRLETAQAGSPPRKIADFFMTLPSKKDYPDYYLFIKTPISLKEIRNKSEKNKYDTIEDWQNDVRIMCENAKFYNEEGSLVHSNAEEVEKILADIVQDAYKRLGISPPIEPQAAPGPKLKFNVRSTEPTPAPAPVPAGVSSPAPLPAPPAVSTPKVQLKAPAPHNEKPRTLAMPRIPSGSGQVPSTPSQRPAVVQRSSSGATPQVHPSVAPLPVASPFPTQATGPRPGPSMQHGVSSPSPRMGTAIPPAPHRHAPQIVPPGRSTQLPPSQGFPMAAPPANLPLPSTPQPGVSRMNPPFPATPMGVVPHTTPAPPQRQPSSNMSTPAQPPPPRATPAPPVPRPQVPMVPLIRRPLPALPTVESLDFAYDTAETGGSKQLKTTRLRNMRGVTNHSTSIRQESTRLEIVAYLGKQATGANKPKAADGSAMEVDPPVTLSIPAPPHFSLKCEGRRISGTPVSKDPGSPVVGYKWDVPVTSRSAISTIEITVDRPGEKGLVSKASRPETYLIFVGRQS